MPDLLRKTFRQTVIYSAGNLATKLVGLVLLPLYTKYLTTEEFGIYSILEITGQFVTLLAGLGLSSGMMRWWATQENENLRKITVFSTWTGTLILAILLNLILYPFNNRISVIFFGHPHHAGLFFLLWIWVGLDSLNRVIFELLRLKEKAGYFVLLVIIKFLVILVLNILLVAYYQQGIKGIMLGYITGNLVITIITIHFITQNSIFRIDRNIIVAILQFSIPLVLSSVASMALALGDRYFIGYFLSYSEVGIYSMAYKIASVIHLILVQSFILGYTPMAYKMFNQPEARENFAYLTTYFLLGMMVFSLFIVIFARELVLLFASGNHDFLPAIGLIPLLCLTMIFRGLQSVVSLALHFVLKTRFNLYIVVITVLVNIVLNLFLIPLLGMYGAAISSLAANFLMLALFYLYAQKYYPIPYELFRMSKLLAAGVLPVILSLYIQPLNLYVAIGVKTILFLLYPVFLYWMKFYNAEEIRKLIKIISGHQPNRG